MKKTLILLLMAIVIIQTNSMASSLISKYGKYENDDMKFYVIYFSGNSSPKMINGKEYVNYTDDVRINIVSKKGYAIFNRTYFIYNGRSYIFNARIVKNYFYKKGYRKFPNTRLKKNSIIELVYEVRRKGPTDNIYTRKVKKKFKVVLSKNIRTRKGKIDLVELK